ncbi:MAG: hypothetical protein JXA37_05075 [Chloroflexia bacterium]|nr:hypothetical protein [Chloroflexia bacterium]
MISEETVTRTWQNMAMMSPAQVVPLIRRLEKEQPLILGHLLFLDDFPFNAHEKEIILYVGVVTWQIMRQSERRLRKGSPKVLEKAEDANYEFLEMLDSDTKADFVSACQRMIEGYPEEEVLRYVVEAIMDIEDDDPDDPPIRDEYRGLAFVHLKIALDALVASLD